MVTLISQNLNEFELHLRAILGLPIPNIIQYAPAASAVILATETSDSISFTGIESALSVPDVDVRLFGKPDSRPYRRMGVALATAETTDLARAKAVTAASQITLGRG
jgi:phosphoribosylglycinamide formyltransferase 2